MEVTRNNFKESLPLIRASIQKADFLVIDTEFTGLLNGKEVSMFDTPQEYYLRLLNGASDFLLIQYGLCAFYWDDSKGHYMNDAYNFYLFPRGRPGPEKMFLCQSSSLNFLASQGFDFNKLIKEGISYMTETTETRLRETLTERQKHYSQDKCNIVIPEENKKQIEEVCQQVQDFLKEKQNDEMEIDKCNAFVRRLLFQELGKRFKDEAHIESKLLENKKRVLKVTRLASAKEAEHREQLKKDKEWEDFDEAVGFSKVARMISQSEKLVVGHNMLLDILHTMNHFFQPLTPDFAAFKEFAHCMFPALLDTKYMSSLPPFKDKVNSSVLSHLLDTLSVEPFHLPKVECVEGRGYTLAQDKAHEAGFDAFVTGLCFVAMHAHVARMRGEADGARARALASTVALKPFLNKLYLARTAHQNSPYINLAGDEPTPSRDHVFFLTFPKEWLRNDINNLFSPFGLVTVQFIDDTSAIVALTQRENIKEMVRRLGKNKMVKLIPFNEYKSNLAKNTQDGKTWRRQDEDSPLKSSLNSRFGQGSPARHWFTKSIATQQQAQSKVARSASTDSSPPITQRKRTSSGAFQIDDEPPQKKLEHQRSLSDDTQKRSELKAKRKLADDEKRVQMGNEHENKNEGEANTEIKFDSENGGTKTEFASAFKESDIWE